MDRPMSAVQWGRAPRDWADLAEPSNEPLYAEVLGALELRAGSRLLDLGCGSGYAARMAADRGAQVTARARRPPRALRAVVAGGPG
jgi:protein-L-isoaspartate O-methyltransferase